MVAFPEEASLGLGSAPYSFALKLDSVASLKVVPLV